jgi:hypothetical protein
MERKDVYRYTEYVFYLSIYIYTHLTLLLFVRLIVNESRTRGLRQRRGRWGKSGEPHWPSLDFKERGCDSTLFLSRR